MSALYITQIDYTIFSLYFINLREKAWDMNNILQMVLGLMLLPIAVSVITETSIWGSTYLLFTCWAQSLPISILRRYSYLNLMSLHHFTFQGTVTSTPTLRRVFTCSRVHQSHTQMLHHLIFELLCFSMKPGNSFFLWYFSIKL